MTRKGSKGPPVYVARGPCSVCGEEMGYTETVIRLMNIPPMTSGHGERPRCFRCRKKARAEAAKLGKPPACAVAGKIGTVRQLKMLIVRPPKNGVPLFDKKEGKWYVLFYPGWTSREKIYKRDQRRAYLAAEDEDEAADAAKDWYTRALMRGARWLPEDFRPDLPPRPKPVLPEDISKVVKNFVDKDLRSIWTRKKSPVRLIRRRKKVISYIDTFIVKHGDKVVSGVYKDRKTAAQRVRTYKEKIRRPKRHPMADLKNCSKCGKPPVWDGETLIHEDPEKYCANEIAIKDKRFPKHYKIAIWNHMLRLGGFGGCMDFRPEHLVLAAPPQNDPLDGFEI